MKLIKNFKWFTMALVIIMGASFFSGCQNSETKKVETETTTMPTENKTDTLPALDTDTLSSTKPETIKNH